MPDAIYEQFEGGGTVTVSFNAGNQRVTGIAVNNPTTRTWTGRVYDPASRQPNGTYTVAYELTCGPGQTVSRSLPGGALRMRQITGTDDYEILNTATGLWERPIPYSSSMS